MTTIRDVLNDLALQVIKETRKVEKKEDIDALFIRKNELIDETIERIKERIVG